MSVMSVIDDLAEAAVLTTRKVHEKKSLTWRWKVVQNRATGNDRQRRERYGVLKTADGYATSGLERRRR